ncbi:zinc finger protein 135-like [Ornithodoros turicata]|uniref:zinc finger protein 135-like n=1 Tax=Ornithodoros turicata TaxID=34597 RepID=UPI003139A3A7
MFVSKSGGRIAHFEEEVDQLPASVRVVVLHCGTNDMPDTDPDMAIRRYVQLIDHIRSQGNIELVCNPRAFAFSQRLMTLCRSARDLYFLDHGFHRQPPTRVLAADGLHPSFEGVTQIAHRLQSLVPRLLRRLPTRLIRRACTPPAPAAQEPPGRHRCSFCDYSSPYKARTTCHERTHTGEKPYVCPVCSKGFSQKFSLDRHLVAIHKGQRNFACSVCGGAFSSKDSLDRHSKEVHEDQRNFSCSICVNRSDRSPVLGEAPKRHRCSFCPYSSDYTANLKMHKRIHTGERPYVCQVCFRGFSQKASLDRHSEAVPECQRNYPFSVCRCAFKRNHHLQRHLRVHFK